MTVSRASATALLHSVQRGLSPIELVYVPHDRWPLSRSRLPPQVQRPLQISILDSSFNPPTSSHLALANAPRPSTGDTDGEYDAKIFLLSVRNADKSLKPSDASYVQRLEMMLLLAQDSITHDSSEQRVAIAIIDEPIFRLSALQAGVTPLTPPRPQLTFMLGFDTLERVLSPRYYGASPTDPEAQSKMFSSLHNFFSAEYDNSRVVCARRASSLSSEAATLALAERFLSEKYIVLIDIGEDEQTYSSTAVRDAIGRRDDHGWKKMVSPGVREYITKQRLYVDPLMVD
ncbi:hypothetical protein B0H10DRAFT_2008396 [Mycena sp. CBHHK59/15]|nr:hypothetical protein B0H10DRAFT_2008396 [Mycena sp. CBHHK59/15]